MNQLLAEVLDVLWYTLETLERTELDDHHIAWPAPIVPVGLDEVIELLAAPFRFDVALREDDEE